MKPDCQTVYGLATVTHKGFVVAHNYPLTLRFEPAARGYVWRTDMGTSLAFGATIEAAVAELHKAYAKDPSLSVRVQALMDEVAS